MSLKLWAHLFFSYDSIVRTLANVTDMKQLSVDWELLWCSGERQPVRTTSPPSNSINAVVWAQPRRAQLCPAYSEHFTPSAAALTAILMLPHL